MKTAIVVVSIVAVIATVKAIVYKFSIMGLVHMLVEKYGDAVDETELKLHIDYCIHRWIKDLWGKNH